MVIGCRASGDLLVNDFVIGAFNPDKIIKSDLEEDVISFCKLIKNKRIFIETPLNLIIGKPKNLFKMLMEINNRNNNSMILKNFEYKILNKYHQAFSEPQILYGCDVVFSQTTELNLKCVKNRHGSSFEINLNEINKLVRKFKLERIDDQ